MKHLLETFEYLEKRVKHPFGEGMRYFYISSEDLVIAPAIFF